MSDLSLDWVQAFIDALPYSKALEMKAEEVSEGRIAVSMPYQQALAGDPQTGVLHGGAISALMDTTSGTSVMTLPQGFGTATLDLRIDYMRAATPGQTVRASAECYHVTRTVAFVRTTAWDDDRNNPVATATGAFTYGHMAAPRTPVEMQAAMQALAARQKELGQ
ncbi:PaaI family thioesterase [Oceanicola sp. 502str15]|uniref:PaaI family thioesterase n=1 Tax=Oceanicola sp. 502str15 TaxID=2696061 RepID=UPI002094A730|nr:PaaI family thioesterase [Oceanicola sp. 502str15]MCO6383611.1 hotdog fold thioesterase [Oceanicola sp. 502str15]